MARLPVFFPFPCGLARYVLLLLALCFAGDAARAHAYLQKSEPAPRAVLSKPPREVQLWFSERLEPAFCKVSVTDATGVSVDKHDMRVAPDNPKKLAVDLNPLAGGVYTVRYRVLSVDGHVVSDTFTFTVRGRR